MWCVLSHGACNSGVIIAWYKLVVFPISVSCRACTLLFQTNHLCICCRRVSCEIVNRGSAWWFANNVTSNSVNNKRRRTLSNKAANLDSAPPPQLNHNVVLTCASQYIGCRQCTLSLGSQLSLSIKTVKLLKTHDYLIDILISNKFTTLNWIFVTLLLD